MANMARNALTCTAAPFKHDGSSLLLQGFNQILLSVFMKTLFANGATRNISFPTSSEEGMQLNEAEARLLPASNAEII